MSATLQNPSDVMHALAQSIPPFIPAWSELAPFVGEIAVTCTIVAVLIVPFFTSSNVLVGLTALAGVAIGLLSMMVIGPVPAGAHFAAMLVADPAAYAWKCLLLLFLLGIILLWFAIGRERQHASDAPEFFTLLLGASVGLMLMASANNLLMLLLAIELASFPSYVLAGFRKTSRRGAEASLKYVVFGAASTAIMTYGLSLLYGLFGTLSWPAIVEELPFVTSSAGHGSAIVAIGGITLLVGIGFKIAMVPVHFWCPDVFDGADIEVGAFLSVASKGAALLLLLRLTSSVAAVYDYAGHIGGLATPVTVIAVVLGVLATISSTLGNVAALGQQSMRRLLAYSSIAQAGYLLTAITLMLRTPGLADPTGTAARILLLYLAIYLLMNLGVFTVAGLVHRQTRVGTIEGFTGLGRRSPVLAICMTLCLVSLVGLPPAAGFSAKFTLLVALLQAGGWWGVLAAGVVINTVISLAVYFRIARVMFFRETTGRAFFGHPIGVALAAACGGTLVLLFIATGPLTRWAEHFAVITR